MTDFAPADISAVLSDPQMARVADKLPALIRPSIRLHLRVAGDGEDLPMGGTRFGGQPDLPVGTSWPMGHLEVPPPTEALRTADKDSRFLPENGTFSLPFVAQIRLSEVRSHDTEKRLPSVGLLYFFYNESSFVSDTGGTVHATATIDGKAFSYALYGFGDPATWRVLFFSDENTKLERRSLPLDIPDHERYKPNVPVALLAEPTLPHVETGFIGEPDSERGALMLTAEEWGFYADVLHSEIRVSPIHQMLGHSDDSQPYAMEGSFQRIRPVLFPELPPFESLTEAEQQQESIANRLLLQIDAHDNGMWFGRGGRLYFFIRESDLAARDFSRVWAQAQ
ncbi:MAG: YwqG family protein [Armatimonadota bacterium]